MQAKEIDNIIARELGVRREQVTKAIELLDAGNTVPFIARYRKEATGALVRKMIAEHGDDACTVTLYFGEGQTEENAQAIADHLQTEFENAEFMVLAGGQPLYYYYVAVQ